MSAYEIPSERIALHFAALGRERDQRRADERCRECDRPLTYQERGLCLGCRRRQVEEDDGR